MNELILDNSRPLVLGPSNQPQENALATFRHMVGAVRSNRGLALFVGAAIFVVVMGAGLIMHRSYYAEAMVIIQPGQENLAQTDTQTGEPPPDTSAVDTEVEVLRSPAVAEAVVQRLKLYDDPQFGGVSPARNSAGWQGFVSLLHDVGIAIPASVQAQPKPAPKSAEVMRRVVGAVMGRSRIRRIGLTYMVQVGFVASSVTKAETVANAIVAAYMAQKMDQKLAAVKRADDDLGITLAGLRDKALQAQSRVEQYVSKNGLVGEDTSALAEGELSSLNQKLADAQADATEKMAATAVAAHEGNGGADGSGTIGVLRQREADITATLAQLQTQFGPQYPDVKKSQAELQDIRAEIQAETRRVVAGLEADAQEAERREASLVASRQQVESRIAANNQARVGLLPLQQAADSAKTIYETYLRRASEVTAERGLQTVDATVESRAVPGPDSLLASKRFLAFIALVLAAIGSIAIVLISEMWTPRIRSLRDVRRETGLPVVGLLPNAEIPPNTVNCIAENHLTVVAEVFRSLGAYLSHSEQRDSKIIAVTSATPSEGKTLTSVCLARTLAATGSRVLLMDCDLRNPSTTRFFAKPHFGVAEIINNSVPVERALVHDEKSGIWFLSGTGGGEIPAFLFSDHRVDALLGRLAEQFDHIILDTPPVLGFADARILSSKADKVILMIRWNKTPAAIVNAAMEVLRLCNARVMGVVLNRVDVRQQAAYGFADGSDYYHYYRSAYPTLI